MVRYGIAGFGLHAVKRLMPGFASAKDSIAVALSRRDLAKGAESAAQHNIPHVFGGTRELCACRDVDAVFVTSPNAFHRADVLACVEARKPVICEKPFAMNSAEAAEMVEAAAAAGVLLGVAHVFRFERSVNRIRALLERGIIGAPVLARCDFSTYGTNHPRKWLTDREVAGGGPIADIGVHCIDALRYMLNDEPRSVSAAAAYDDHFRNVEASGALTLEFSRGVLATVAVSYRAQYHTPVQITGTEAILFAEDALSVEKPVVIEVRKTNGTLLHREEVDNADAYALQVDAFSNAVNGRASFLAPGEQGLINQRILDAAYRSARSGARECI